MGSAFSDTAADRNGCRQQAGIVPASDHGGTMEAETPTDGAPADEILVEEISVDGMCGVY